jgi:uncharacterized protein (DUF4415 family)
MTDIRKKPTEAELRAHLETIPFAEDEAFTDEDLASGRVVYVGRGMQAFEKYHAEKMARGRPKKEIRQELVSLRIPETDLAHLRSKGKNWRAKVREHIARGIETGIL